MDEVNDLGHFLEFEAVMDTKFDDRSEETNKVNRLLKLLKIDQVDLISESYENLIKK